jgi:hypothetical protein
MKYNMYDTSLVRYMVVRSINGANRNVTNWESIKNDIFLKITVKARVMQLTNFGRIGRIPFFLTVYRMAFPPLSFVSFLSFSWKETKRKKPKCKLSLAWQRFFFEDDTVDNSNYLMLTVGNLHLAFNFEYKYPLFSCATYCFSVLNESA